jgi:hypothetical protein
MLALDVITQIRSALVEPVPSFWSNEELLGWINRAEKDFANRTHIFQDIATTSTVASQATYALPANLLSVRALMYNNLGGPPPVPNTPNWIRLVPSNLEKFAQETPNFMSTTTDTLSYPRKYAIWNNQIYLYPPPLTGGSSDLVLFYIAHPVQITDVNAQLNLDDAFEDGIIAYVLSKAYQKETEVDKMDEQTQIYESYVKLGLRMVKKQSGDQRYKLDISSPQPFEGPYDRRFNPLA